MSLFSPLPSKERSQPLGLCSVHHPFCTPPFPSRRPHVSPASPLGLGAEMLAPGEGCSGAWLLPRPLVLGQGIVDGCAWQSVHKEEASGRGGILPLAARFPSW